MMMIKTNGKSLPTFRGLILVALISVGLLILGVYLFLGGRTNDFEHRMEYWEKNNFRTDTIIVDFDYSKIPSPVYQYTVPPATVHVFNPTTQPAHVIVVRDSSLFRVIDSLKNEITEIHENYLKLYPKAPKILYGAFSGDSLRLDLLDITG